MVGKTQNHTSADTMTLYSPTAHVYFRNRIEDCAELLYSAANNIVHVYAPCQYKSLRSFNDVGGSLRNFTFHCTKCPNKCRRHFQKTEDSYDFFFEKLCLYDNTEKIVEFMDLVNVPHDAYKKRLLFKTMSAYSLECEYDEVYENIEYKNQILQNATQPIKCLRLR